MDLVTLFTVCGLATGAPAASSNPAHSAASRHLIAAADSGNTQLPATAGTAAPAIDRWRSLIAEASRRFGIPESWVRAVMAAESGGHTILDGRPITSSAGAMGLMQVMPDTYAEMRQRLGLGADPYDPRDNILAGAAFLRAMYDRYGYPGVFAAYNAGPQRFDDYLLRGIALPDETRRYLLAIGSGVHDAVAAMRPDVTREPFVAGRPTAAPPSSTALFFALGTVPAATARSLTDITSPYPSAPDFGSNTSPSGGFFVPFPDAPPGVRDKP
jgi:soluble lytic murein transglycosylase-like protein